MGRKSHVRGKEEALEMVEEADSSSRIWTRLRGLYPKKVRERVDIVAEMGGLSLHDIELLEFASHEVLAERIKRLERRPMTATAIASLESIRLQGRKHLRNLRLAQNPITDPNNQRHPEPESEAKKADARARLAEKNATKAQAIVAAVRPDTGDELVS